jgi:hypothetical protein
MLSLLFMCEWPEPTTLDAQPLNWGQRLETRFLGDGHNVQSVLGSSSPQIERPALRMGCPTD